MSAAPVGSLVSLYYDSPRPIEEGEYIQTKTLRTYRIESVRVQARGKHVGRKHIMAVVVNHWDVEEGAKIHPLHWYSRGKSRQPPKARSVLR